MTRVPFSDPAEPIEYVSTAAGRIACESCGEWIYPRRRVESAGPFAFPPECPVCGAAVPVSVTADQRSAGNGDEQ